MTNPTDGPLLELDRVSVALSGHPVLIDASCTIGPGEVVAIMGPNGSGKSTMIRSALGLVPLSGGSVKLFDTPLQRFRDWARVGYVPQRATVAVRQATVNDVVSAGRLGHRRPFVPMGREDRAAIAEALELVRLTDRRSDELAQLSGGQQQRALIARALAARPDLLILDEPTAGVDLAQQQVLADVIGDLVAGGRAMLVVLHETGPFRPLLHRAVLLEHGRVVHSGAVPHVVAGHDHHHAPAQVAVARGRPAAPVLDLGDEEDDAR